MKKIRYIFIMFLALVISKEAFSQAPSVTSVSPQRQVINAPRGTAIVVNFSTALKPVSVNNNSFRVFGKQLGPVTGTLELLNGNTQIKFTPANMFNAGEWVTVTISRGIQAQDNTPIAFGYNWNFWTKAEPGTLNQSLIKTIPVRRSGEGLIQCYGALGMDFNDDRKTDLAIVNEVSRDFRVFLNNGTNYDTMYALYPIPSGNFPSPSEAADFNRDGKVDIAIGNAGNNVMSLFMSNGNGNFQTGIPHIAANNVRGVGVADFEGDGFDDIITANRGGSNISLFKNNGSGAFGPPVNINTAGGGETGVMMADANNDGIMDAFIGCYSSSEIVLMLGDGNGSFTYSSRSPINGQVWAIVVGDINGDGNVDVAGCLSSANKIGVIFGNGTGGLGPTVNYVSGQFPLAIDIGDIDGDNDLDLIASDYVSGDYKVYGNNGSGVFTNTPITLPASSAGSCMTVHDRDNDGDLDLAGIDEVDDLLFIFNNGPVGIQNGSSLIPDEYRLHQNYPNPFNPETVINFELKNTGFVNLKIYDVNGKEVRTLLNQREGSGQHSISFDGKDLPSGIYFYILEVDGKSLTKIMALIK
ncbi:MAG: FG-GAP-like repeat-containing protein [Bacteroidota bacterium]|nr:FG-GAP-like repeat-containing protein [Bacteroidota bacterium]